MPLLGCLLRSLTDLYIKAINTVATNPSPEYYHRLSSCRRDTEHGKELSIAQHYDCFMRHSDLGSRKVVLAVAATPSSWRVIKLALHTDSTGINFPSSPATSLLFFSFHKTASGKIVRRSFLGGHYYAVILRIAHCTLLTRLQSHDGRHRSITCSSDDGCCHLRIRIGLLARTSRMTLLIINSVVVSG